MCVCVCVCVCVFVKDLECCTMHIMDKKMDLVLLDIGTNMCKKALIRKRRNQKEIPKPKSEVAKN